VFSAKPESTLHEVLRDLNRENCSTRLESIPNETVKLTPIPLACEPATDNESLRDRKKEDCPARAESILHETLRDLRSAVFSAELVSILHEALKFSA